MSAPSFGLLPATFLVALCPATPAFAQPFRVALIGDSVVEGPGAASPDGLGAAVRSALAGRGYAAAGLGYIAAHGASVVATDGVRATPWQYSGLWIFEGLSPFFTSDRVLFTHSTPFGAAGYTSEAPTPGSVATARLAGDAFGVVHVRTPAGAPFIFSVDGRSRVIDPRRAGPPSPAVAWLRAPAPRAAHRVSVISAGRGWLHLSGVIARAGPPGAAEVSQIGHACACADENLASEQREELALLRPDLTILLFGVNDAGEYLATGDPDVRTRFAAALATRADLARRSGGACLIVPPARAPQPWTVRRDFRILARGAAFAAGCGYAPLFDGVWDEGDLLTYDGVHPTALGYARMGERLAGRIAAAASARGAPRDGAG